MLIRPNLTYSLLCPEVVQYNLHIFLKEQHLAQENQKTAVSEQEHGEMLFFFFLFPRGMGEDDYVYEPLQ